MLITAVTYGQVQNLGNFQTRRCEVTVAVNPTDDPTAAVAYARAFVEASLGLTMTTTPPAAQATAAIHAKPKRTVSSSFNFAGAEGEDI